MRQYLNSKYRQFKKQFNQYLLRSRSAKTLILSYEHPISRAQIDPVINFHLKHKVKYLELNSEILNSPRQLLRLSKLTTCKQILIQSAWNAPTEWIEGIKQLKSILPSAKIVYMDWFAPLHIPQPKLLNYCDIYLKKQIPRDITLMTNLEFDTNLEKYESQWGAALVNGQKINIEPQLIKSKLYLGWNFATDNRLHKLLKEQQDAVPLKNIDLHCRIFSPTERDTWYKHMRGRAFDVVTKLKNEVDPKFKLLSENKLIPFEQYLKELSSSKVCFSPFGYGEVCWRDFEAILCGAVLLKPDMSHIETRPNIYQAYVTYVPVSWDFSDLEEKFLWLMDHPEEMQEITKNAKETWLNYLNNWDPEWEQLQARLD
jgi:hypothetical protein